MSDFPDRPTHPDFTMLSEIVMALDFTSQEDFALFLAGFVDPASIEYMANGRAKLVMRNLTGQPTRLQFTAAFGAMYLDGFLAGQEFARRKSARPAQRRRAEGLLDELGDFDEECERAEYTDTGRAWELLYAAQALLRELVDEPEADQ